MSGVAKSNKSKKSKQKPVVQTSHSFDEEEIVNANDELEFTPSPVEKKKKSKKSIKSPPIANPVKAKSPPAAVQLVSPRDNRSSSSGLNLSTLHPANADLALDVGLEEDEDVVMYSVNDLPRQSQDEDVLYSVADLKRQRAEQIRRDKLVTKQRKMKEKEIQAQKKKMGKSNNISSPPMSGSSHLSTSPRDQFASSNEDSALGLDDEEAGHDHPHGSNDGFTALKGVGPNGSSAYYLLLVFVTALTLGMVGLVVYYTENVNANVIPWVSNSSSSSTGSAAPVNDSSSLPSLSSSS